MNRCVPQGSCLAPLLFIIYASKLFRVVEDQLLHKRCYAYDTQIYLEFNFKPSNSRSEEDAMRVMECCIKKIWRWRIQDRLLVNDDKTEFRIIGTRQQFRKLQAINIKVGSSEKKQKLSVSKMWWREAVPGMGLGSRCTCPFGNLR